MGASRFAAPFWERPGRTHVETNYDIIPFPHNDNDESPGSGQWDDLSTFERRKFDQTDWTAFQPRPDQPDPPPTTHHPLMLSRRWTLDELNAYLGTWSALNTYNQRHGDGDALRKGFLEELQAELRLGQGETVEVQWPMAIMLFRKRGRL
jgi:hypothetical protein